MDYQALRTFADSWGLVFMCLILMTVVGWTFRPGAKQAHDDARMIPLREQAAADANPEKEAAHERA